MNITLVIGAGLLIAICSATQDITIDALRIEQIEKEDTAAMAAGASVAVIGWWSGFKIGGLIALMVADKLEMMGIENYWQMTFILLGGIIILCNIGLLFIPEAGTAERQKAQAAAQASFQQKLGGDSLLSQATSWIGSTVLMPLLSFFQKNGLKMGIAILSFIFLFKIGEAFMGKMSIIFYKEVGFSKSDIAIYSKGTWLDHNCCLYVIGRLFCAQIRRGAGLLLSGAVMASTNILFSILAWTGKVEWLFAVAVILDDLAAAFATVAFVTFISLLVDRNYTATQYALLASIGTLGRTLLASSSGELVDWLKATGVCSLSLPP